MNQHFPLYFEIKPKASFADQQKEVIETQEKLLHSLTSRNANLIISLRYINLLLTIILRCKW
jgi:hypothetical protein